MQPLLGPVPGADFNPFWKPFLHPLWVHPWAIFQFIMASFRDDFGIHCGPLFHISLVLGSLVLGSLVLGSLVLGSLVLGSLVLGSLVLGSLIFGSTKWSAIPLWNRSTNSSPSPSP